MNRHSDPTQWRQRFAAVCLAVTVALAAVGGVSALDTGKPYHFGFKKSRNGETASINEEGFKPLVDKYGAIFTGDTSQKELYLTFDNGYENGYTDRILDVLKEKNVPATFFVTGHYVEDQPDLVKRMAAEGHLIGNHSWSHPDMTRISDGQIRTELQRIEEAVQRLTPQKEVRFLRPPRGIFSERTLAVANDMGLTHVFWSVAYKDWETDRQRGGGLCVSTSDGAAAPGCSDASAFGLAGQRRGNGTHHRRREATRLYVQKLG